MVRGIDSFRDWFRFDFPDGVGGGRFRLVVDLVEIEKLV